MIVFGPVPSRRLGYSLGINHIPPKNCTYSCVYCQVGRTTHLGTTRQNFYSVGQVLQEVHAKISESANTGRAIDYLTLVPDGEPTLDINLGKLIKELKRFDLPIAVISNGSLMDCQDVQEDLLLADWVSLKVDAIIEADWCKVDRPHKSLSLPAILAGMLYFRSRYQGELVTETMLISGLNDSSSAIHQLCEYLNELKPLKSYLSIPTRPPAESWVRPPDADSLQRVFQILNSSNTFMDLLFELENTDFQSTGNIAEDILGITAVHPIREEAMQNMVSMAQADWSIVEELLASGKIARIQYREVWFYVRRFETGAQARLSAK
jgi:wyosine [tRNA(Phe)-imidazoG37] synthetase (radical SAM superfamily)